MAGKHSGARAMMEQGVSWSLRPSSRPGPRMRRNMGTTALEAWASHARRASRNEAAERVCQTAKARLWGVA